MHELRQEEGQDEGEGEEEEKEQAEEVEEEEEEKEKLESMDLGLYFKKQLPDISPNVYNGKKAHLFYLQPSLNRLIIADSSVVRLELANVLQTIQ